MSAFVDKHRLLQNVLQVVLVVASNYLAFWLRFEGDVPPLFWSVFINTIGWLVMIRVVAFARFGLFTGLWQYADIFDFTNVIAAVGLSSAASYVLFHVLGFGHSRSVLVIDSALLVLGLCGVRLLPRVARLWRHKDGHKRKEGQKRMIIYGAGGAGEMIVRDMCGSPNGYEPLGFIDDDMSKVGHRIHGVPVLGGRADLPSIIERTQPHEVLVAMPSASPAAIQAVVSSLQPFKIPISTLPSVRDIIGGRVAVNQIRELTIADLLPRAPIDLDPEVVARLIRGRRVLVTGAGGSIGSELSRQIAAFDPAALVLYERYENALHDLANELLDRFQSVKVWPVIGDVTDRQHVDQLMAEHRPHIVFHAAAHKHVPLMEQHPCEAVKNNVVGTLTLAAAAERWQVERFILISTDKAVNPSSVMGATKRVCELILQGMRPGCGTRFAAVRFGNVLGSNGSVLLRFLTQIRGGGPVTVTHPDVKRYFMLIPEAVQLVLHAGAEAAPGMIYVLEMGEQIKLVTFARNLIRLAGLVPDREIAIRFVGLRPGEKLFEELVAADEMAEPTPIPQIIRLRGLLAIDSARIQLQVAELVRRAVDGDSEAVIEQLQRLVPTFAHASFESSPASAVTIPDARPEAIAGAAGMHALQPTEANVV